MSSIRSWNTEGGARSFNYRHVSGIDSPTYEKKFTDGTLLTWQEIQFLSYIMQYKWKTFHHLHA